MDVVSYRIHACILGLVGCLVMSILGLCFAKCGFRNEKYAVLYNGKFRCPSRNRSKIVYLEMPMSGLKM
jgi:hypothetical protein